MLNLSNIAGDPGNQKTSSSEGQIHTYQDLEKINVTDGSEFLDDAIRMKEQPLGNSEHDGDNIFFNNYE